MMLLFPDISYLYHIFLPIAGLTSGYLIYRSILKRKDNRRFASAHKCQPPKRLKTKDPFFGLDLARRFNKWIKDGCLLDGFRKTFFIETNVRTCVVNLLGKQIIVTIEPENVKAILATQFKDFGFGSNRDELKPLLGEGIFSTDGEQWHRSREMLRPAFAKSQIADLELFDQHVSNLIAAIKHDQKTNASGEEVDLSPLFFRFTMDVATEFLFGESTLELSPSGQNLEAVKMRTAFEYCGKQMGGDNGHGLLLGIFYALFPKLNRGLMKNCKVVHAFVDRIVAKAQARRAEQITSGKAQHRERFIFLEELLDETSDPLKLRSELLNIMLAGRDTTAGLLTNTFFVLAREPSILVKLRAELDALHLDGASPSYDQLKNMKYLRAVFNESLRLYPIVPENGKEAQINTTIPLGGGPDQSEPVFIGKGQTIGYSVYSMHRLQEYFGEDVETFKPERWLDTEGHKGIRPGWAYLPFNGGPRVCIGQQFALAEAGYVTVRLLQEFDSIESRDDKPWREKFTITCSSHGGAKVAMR